MTFTIEQIGAIWFFIFGAIIGSFLNATIYRLPRGFLLTLPSRSMCTKCVRQLKWYENIPLLSFLFLRGKCLGCKTPIGVRYFIVELLNALLFYAVYVHFGFTIDALISCFLVSSLIAITFIDIDFRIIPDEISIGGSIIILLLVLLFKRSEFVAALLGAVSGAAVLFSMGFIYEKITNREGMGLGDVKLLILIGAVLGVKGAFGSIIISSFVGSIVGLTMMFFQKKDLKMAIPFGPFLAIGALIFLFWGDSLTLSIYSG